MALTSSPRTPGIYTQWRLPLDAAFLSPVGRAVLKYSIARQPTAEMSKEVPSAYNANFCSAHRVDATEEANRVRSNLAKATEVRF